MNKKSVCSYKIAILIILLFLLAGQVNAAESGLRINEIAWMGTEASWADEWIELYNPTDKSINLQEWKLITQDESLQVNLQGVIEPDSFFVLERTDEETLPEIEADQIYTGGLSNEGQYLKLVKDNEVIHEVNDAAGWRAGNSDECKTMEKGKEGWHTSRETGGTPKEVNSEPLPKEEQMPAKPLTSSLEQGYSDFWFTLMVALVTSAFSALVIYYLKQQLKSK